MKVLLFAGLILALYLWFRSCKSTFRIRQFRPNTGLRTLSAILPLFCIAFIVVVLRKESSPDVRSDTVWIIWYTIGGAIWLELSLFLLSLFGIAERDDVLERQNAAAAWVVYGAMIGATFCYAGSNVGNGPGVEAVFFCAVLSTAFLFGFWFLLERIFNLSDRITIDREESAGIRVGGWIASLGLVFGGAVAGDWVSVAGTIRDFFHYAWVTLPFLLAAIVTEAAVFRGSKVRGNAQRIPSFAMTFVYLTAAAIYVAWRGVH